MVNCNDQELRSLVYPPSTYRHLWPISHRRLLVAFSQWLRIKLWKVYWCLFSALSMGLPGEVSRLGDVCVCVYVCVCGGRGSLRRRHLGVCVQMWIRMLSREFFLFSSLFHPFWLRPYSFHACSFRMYFQSIRPSFCFLNYCATICEAVLKVGKGVLQLQSLLGKEGLPPCLFKPSLPLSPDADILWA